GIKGGNTYSIPALLSLSYEAKSLAECACQIVRCCPSQNSPNILSQMQRRNQQQSEEIRAVVVIFGTFHGKFRESGAQFCRQHRHHGVLGGEVPGVDEVEPQELGVPELVILDVGGDEGVAPGVQDRKSTRLNSSHVSISYAVFCLKK